MLILKNENSNSIAPSVSEVTFPFLLVESGDKDSYIISEILENVQIYFSENEEILDVTLGITQQDHDLFPQKTPTLKITSSQAEYFVVLNEYTYDDGGFLAVKAHELAPETKPEEEVPKIKVGNPIAMFFVKEFSKALAKTVAKELYYKFFPKENNQLLKSDLAKLSREFREIVNELLQELKYENLEDLLIGSRAWLQETYSIKLEAIEQGKYNNLVDLWTDLNQRQQEMQKIVNIIEYRLSDALLKECSYITRVKVTLYAACAALRIVLFKELIYIEQCLTKQGQDKYNTITTDLRELEEFKIKTSDNLDNYINKLAEGRYSHISDISHHNNLESVTTISSWFTGNKTYSGEAYYEWKDEFESKNPNDPLQSDKIHQKYITAKDSTLYQKSPIRHNAHTDRETHYENVKRRMVEKIIQPLTDISEKIRSTSLEIKID